MKFSPVVVPEEEAQSALGSFKSASHVLLVKLTISLFYYCSLYFIYIYVYCLVVFKCFKWNKITSKQNFKRKAT